MMNRRHFLVLRVATGGVASCDKASLTCSFIRGRAEPRGAGVAGLWTIESERRSKPALHLLKLLLGVSQVDRWGKGDFPARTLGDWGGRKKRERQPGNTSAHMVGQQNKSLAMQGPFYPKIL